MWELVRHRVPFILEQPVQSLFRELPEVQRLMRRNFAAMDEVVLEQCAFGAVGCRFRGWAGVIRQHSGHILSRAAYALMRSRCKDRAAQMNFATVLP